MHYPRALFVIQTFDKMDKYPVNLIAFTLSVAIHAVVTCCSNSHDIENNFQQLTISYYAVDLIAMVLSVVTDKLPRRYDRWRDFTEDVFYLIIVAPNALSSTSKLQLIIGYNFAISLNDWFLSRRRSGLVRIQHFFASHGMVQSIACMAFPCLVYLITIVTRHNNTRICEAYICVYAYVSFCVVISAVPSVRDDEVFRSSIHVLIVSTRRQFVNRIALISGMIMITSLLRRIQAATEVEQIDFNEHVNEHLIAGDHANN